MTRPVVHILFKFMDGPWGGGNQFLKALREYLLQHEVYCEAIQDADVVLFNSYPFGCEYELLTRLYAAKRRNPRLLVVHRVDGPIALVRGRDLAIDRFIFDFNQTLSNGTVFQSGWSRGKCLELGMTPNAFEATILNACDPKWFYPAPANAPSAKTRIIATSWSANPKKGFDVYRYLDGHLDFSRYEMTFVGNSPTAFTNIHHVKPVPSSQLGDHLRAHDIFITASQDDPCSNSLIEALTCGLPAVGLNSGGHPEIIGEGGVVFDGTGDVLRRTDEVAADIKRFRARIALPGMEAVGASYYEFCKTLYEAQQRAKYKSKPFGLVALARLLARAYGRQYWDRAARKIAAVARHGRQ